MADAARGGRPLGRPKDTDSAETRQRILEVARGAFASGGYDSSTNRDLAAEVGIAAGALYYYYPSKLDLYLAVHEDVQRRVYGRFNEAAEGAEWLRRIEEENAGDLTPEKIAAMEKAAAESGEDITAPGDGEPYMKPVRPKGKKVELGEEASPTTSRRFTRA